MQTIHTHQRKGVALIQQNLMCRVRVLTGQLNQF